MLSRDNLHGYQRAAVEHIKAHSHCGLFLDMGLGKTVSTLTAIQDLIHLFEVSRVLVVAPKRVAEHVWTAEVPKWGHLASLRVQVVKGNEAKRIEALRTPADVYTIGRDNLPWLVTQFGGTRLPFDMLVIDESSSFKNHASQRFKALKRVQPSLDRVVLLTGTPAPNSLIDLWPQIWLLDQGARLGKTITAYRTNFFRPGRTNGHIVYNYNLQNGGQRRIYERIGDVCLSMKAEDYLNLPKRQDNYIALEMPAKLAKQYKDFEREKVLELFGEEQDGGEVYALNAAALSGKLLQFANGAVYDENREVKEVHTLKLDALAEILDDANGKPVLLAWTFKHDRDRIMERFKKLKPVQLKTNEHIDKWNRGEIPLMLMHPASGGHGLNLQSGGNILVWFGQTWSLELYQQFNARLHRQGQERGVVVHHLTVKGTIDEEVVRALAKKDKSQEALLAAVKARIEKYLK